MPVMITADTPGMTQDVYDEMASAFLPLLAQRPGFIAHAAWQVAGGWQVMEIWDSEAEHDSWAREVAIPAMPQEIGPLKLTVQPLHNVLTAAHLAAGTSPTQGTDDSYQA